MTIRILTGDCREILKTLPSESVHCCITSPPYYGLRDYGTAKWEGGDPRCDHKPERKYRAFKNGQGAGVDDGKSGASCTSWTTRDGMPVNPCPKCGARRIDSQLGLEPTIQEYVEQMVAVFREVRRVLRKDGTVFLNLGDSYASGEIGRHDALGAVSGNAGVTCKSLGEAQNGKRQQRKLLTGLKPKDLCGIPWRVAFALQADGWWLRQDIIWSKPNPMPESVTDRCTKAHEYVFLLRR